jgi:hypothetical protein
LQTLYLFPTFCRPYTCFFPPPLRFASSWNVDGGHKACGKWTLCGPLFRAATCPESCPCSRQCQGMCSLVFYIYYDCSCTHWLAIYGEICAN